MCPFMYVKKQMVFCKLCSIFSLNLELKFIFVILVQSKNIMLWVYIIIRKNIFFSDEDSSFPASELNTHGPTVQGWRSALGSSLIPHDIILRFQTPAKVCRIQLLAHQYLIRKPSKTASKIYDFSLICS